MKKEMPIGPMLFPMPTYMIGTYCEDGSVDEMMMAWGGICAHDHVALNLEREHATTDNIERTKAFTLAIPGTDTIKESDYLGIVSAHKVPDKFVRTGLHARRSDKVNAPIVEEYPVTLECEVVKMEDEPYGLRVLGKIVGVIADESVLDEKGKIDAGKLNAFSFDQFRNGYYATGEKIAQAWNAGKEFVDKKD